MKLRPYQVAARDAILQAWKDGKKCVALVMPTGAGKSETALGTMREALKEYVEWPANETGLVLVHTKVLTAQSRRRFQGMDVLRIQSLIAKGAAGDRRRASLVRYKVCFIDEVHHLASEQWRGVLPLLAGKLVFGATATPVRSDGTPLGDVCDHMIVGAHYSQLIADGYLCRCDVVRTDVRRKDQKRQKVRPDGVKAYMEHGRLAPDDPRRAQGLEWRPGIYFDGTIAACTEAVARFNAAGIRARLVSCNTGATERQEIFDGYSRGELDMLASPMALAEGFDSPRAEVCVLRRMCDGLGTYLQIVGRVLRPFAGKRRALLIDIPGASEPKTHNMPTDDRVYTLDGAGLASMPPEEEPEEEEEEPVERREWRTIEARYEFIRDSLLARWELLLKEAQESGYRIGWAAHAMRESTSIELPRMLAITTPGRCSACEHGIPTGSNAFWLGGSNLQHHICWFRKLDADALAKVPDSLPPAPVGSDARKRSVQLRLGELVVHPVN